MDNNRLFLAFMLLTILSMWGCRDSQTDNGPCVRGSTEVVTETRSLDEFHAVSASIVGQLFITQGNKYEVIIHTHANLIDDVKTEIVSDELIIELDRCVREMERFEVHVILPSIQSLVFSGVGDVSATNNLDAETLSVNLSGVGNMDLKGTADNFHVVLSGVGDVNAGEMVTKESSVSLTGIGSARVNVSDRLEASIRGTGDILYKGDPELIVSISGNGRVAKIN